MDQNLIFFEEGFVPLLKEAKARGLEYRVEQCPMPGWTPGDNFHNNIAYAPGDVDRAPPDLRAHGVGDQFRVHYDPSHAILMGQDTRSIFQYLKDAGYDFIIGGFHVKGQVIDSEGRRRPGGTAARPCERGDWIDGKPSPNPADQVNAWKKQTVLCEHELPGTARHDPLALPAEPHRRLAGSPARRPRAARSSTSRTRRWSSSTSTRAARIQDKERLAADPEGLDRLRPQDRRGRGCMYALQHEVLPAQGIPVQGVGRQAYRS